MIFVTKSYLPEKQKYQKYLNEVWDKSWLTNNGPLLQQLENDIASKLNLDYFQIVSNGTIALQIGIEALEVKGEIITTPFSYVATLTSILWQKCKPIFCDIESQRFSIDPTKIEQLITANTSAILATHVFGYPCFVEEIERIAKKYKLKVIYDGAHAFGITYKNKSLSAYGDLSTLSFHATKVFHMIEGGGIVCHSAEVQERVYLYKSFGHRGDQYFTSGINGKNSEFHAAMGLCVLQDFEKIVQRRKEITEFYMTSLVDVPIELPEIPNHTLYNYGYFPVLFEKEADLLKCLLILNKAQIFPRRYFYPSLNMLPYIKYQNCPNSENIASRIMCLPLYYELVNEDLELIVKQIKIAFKE